MQAYLPIGWEGTGTSTVPVTCYHIGQDAQSLDKITPGYAIHCIEFI